MKDIFFAILAFWIVYRVWNGLQSLSGGGAPENSKSGGAAPKKDGSVSVDYIPPKKKDKSDPGDGEYIDYEEIK